MSDLPEKETLEEFRKSVADLIGDSKPAEFAICALYRAAKIAEINPRTLFQQYIESRFRLTSMRDFDYHYVPPIEMTGNLRHKILGTDNEGRFVVWLPVGRWELRNFVQSGLKVELFKHVFNAGDEFLRVLYQRGLETGKAHRAILLADYAELSFRQFSHYETIQVNMDLARIAEIMFPLVDKIYVVNAPKVFHYLVKLMRPIISRSTLTKIEILTSDGKKLFEDLSQRISLEILPIDYGGQGPPVLNTIKPYEGKM